MNTDVVTRFAPSPTGFLHVGNIRTALANWLFARSKGGKFILRIDDTDLVRSEQRYVDSIRRDLEWLGLEWDEIFFQSARFDKYKEAEHKLVKSGRLYPCYETQEELNIKKKSLLSRHLPPIYDRASMKLTTDQKKSLEACGVRPHWRFLLNDSEIKWRDGVKGEVSFAPSNLSDPILIRADGSMTYTLASVLDDIDFGITDIIRGEDHVSNSAAHVQIFQALGAAAPRFSHLSLLTARDQEISKRIGGFDIGSLRSTGIEAMAINSFLSKIGTADPVKPYFSLKELVESFDIGKFGRAPTSYDKLELEKLNMKLLHSMSYAMVCKLLRERNIQSVGEDVWVMARNNIGKLCELETWRLICETSIGPFDVDYVFLKLAAAVLPKEPWDSQTFSVWMTQVKNVTKRSGKDLFVAIRLALTGQEQGPELKALLPLIGYDIAFKRLNGEHA